MRIRFSLRSLLAVPLVFALVWLWATWPDRTFDSFQQALRDGRFELATSMVDCGECPLADGKKISFTVDSLGIRMKCGGAGSRTVIPYFLDNLVQDDRGILDILQARTLYRGRSISGTKPQFEFVVERGQITLCYCGYTPPSSRSRSQ